MEILSILLDNLIAIPILSFLMGILCSIFRLDGLFFPKVHSILTYFLLFAIGLKGGGAFMQHSTSQFFLLLAVLIAWGILQPFISYWFLRKFTKTDPSTAAAIAACFGSVSVMTFAAATAFLEKLAVPYQTLVVAALAMMEIPAIFAGLLISRSNNIIKNSTLRSLLKHTLFNKTILIIFLGMAIGVILNWLQRVT